MKSYKVTFITDAVIISDDIESCKTLIRKLRTAIKRGILPNDNIKITKISNEIKENK